MLATFLESGSGESLTKMYRKGEVTEGIVSDSYPLVSRFYSHQAKFDNIDELASLIREHGKKGHCLLKGHLTKDIFNEPRKGLVDHLAKADFAVFDIDGGDYTSPEQFMRDNNMADVSYIVQYSSSMGITTDDFRAHIFVLLKNPVDAKDLRRYLTSRNFWAPQFLSKISLTSHKLALKFPLDVCSCDNGRLIYIAPGILGPGVEDNFQGDRIQVVRKVYPAWTYNSGQAMSEPELRDMYDRVRTQLREKEGLPRRQFKTKIFDNVPNVIKDAEPCKIVGYRDEGEYTRVNLEGEHASWGHWYHTDRPKVLYSFKGDEPTSLKEIDGDFFNEVAWPRALEYRKEAKAEAKYRRNEERAYQWNQAQLEDEEKRRMVVLAFRDRTTDKLWIGEYHFDSEELELNATGAKSNVLDYLKERGKEVPPFIPTWDYTFNPQNRQVIDIQGKWVNSYRPTTYLRDGSALLEDSSLTFEDEELAYAELQVKTPIIHKILLSALGAQTELRHFLNWLAYIYQKAARPGTAWILHGTQGTGKGLMFHRIIEPTFGNEYCREIRYSTLGDQFNAWVRECLFCAVDEAEIDTEGKSAERRKINASIKSMITEPSIDIRDMRATTVKAPNYVNCLFFSNKTTPVTVEAGDRRFNVGKYQNTPLEINQAEVEGIEDELDEFVQVMFLWPLNETKARTPLINVDRTEVQDTSASTITDICVALRTGNLEFFLDNMPAVKNELDLNPAQTILIEQYRGHMKTAATSLKENKGKHFILRDDLRVIFTYLVGDGIPKSPHKFTKLMHHNGLRIITGAHEGHSVRGFRVEWKMEKDLDNYKL